jgi:preprotein translocase subunit SecD
MMDFYKDRRFLALLLAFMIFAVGIFFVAGWLLMVALLFFGFTSLVWKEPHIKLSGMVFLVALAILNITVNGLNFGIDFVGGTRIPVVLEHPVDTTTMNELVQTIKSRASTLGLKEVKARALGNSLVNVEIASTDESTIQFIENTLSQQGVFLGIVDGKVAVSGDHIFRTSISAIQPYELAQSGGGTPPDWGVSFTVDEEGGAQFADAAKGKGDYPIYMFIDRPHDAAVFYDRDVFKTYIDADSGERESLRAINSTLRLEGDDMPVYIIQDLPQNLTAPTNQTKAIVSSNLSEAFKSDLRSRGYTLEEFDDSDMRPEFGRTGSGVLFVDKFEAVGLLTSPILNPSIATGVPNYRYSISGRVNSIDPAQKSVEAAEKVKSIESILKGGALPVQISLGSRTTLPASLGSEFLKLSLIAIVGSLIAISILIGIRYRNMLATMPIVVISLAELTVLISILGSFTIDLSAMAGIIAAIGVGVDAQIVITDELLKRDEHSTKEKVELAFGIIKTNAIVAIFSMVPLLFSGLVEIIGFAMSTMLGALLGYMLTRPAYAALVEKVLAVEGRGDKPRQ